jgi:hypothetical protein
LKESLLAGGTPKTAVPRAADHEHNRHREESRKDESLGRVHGYQRHNQKGSTEGTGDRPLAQAQVPPALLHYF